MAGGLGSRFGRYAGTDATTRLERRRGQQTGGRGVRYAREEVERVCGVVYAAALWRRLCGGVEVGRAAGGRLGQGQREGGQWVVLRYALACPLCRVGEGRHGMRHGEHEMACGPDAGHGARRRELRDVERCMGLGSTAAQLG